MSDETLDIPSWARKSPQRTSKKKKKKKQKERVVIKEGEGEVSLFGQSGGKLEAPVDKLNHHNLPARWFANSTHGPTPPTPIPTSSDVRAFPPTVAKTSRARKFGSGPNKNVPRATIMRYDAEKEAASKDSSKSDEGTETLSTRVADPSFLKLDQSKLPLEIFDNPITYERLFNKGTTPEQWIASRKEAGTPIQAMSPYYNGVEWTWTACEVESYLPETAQFAIKFYPNSTPF